MTARPPVQELVGLRRTWIDPEPGIDLVQVHYACTAPGVEPEWTAAETRVMTPTEDAPGLRSAVLEVPRELGGSIDYLLHHFFFVVQGARSRTSPVVTEEIVAREIRYEEPTGDWTHVGLAWGVVPGDAAPPSPNYTTAALDGLAFASPAAGAPAAPAPVHEFVRAQPLPHVFRGLVWGPRGFDVRYVVHLVRAGTGDDTELWDDNGGPGWTLTL